MDSKVSIRAQNAAQLGRVVNIREAARLQAISRSLHSLDVWECNQGLSERQEKRVEHLEQEAWVIAKEHGYIAYHQGDPRGWSLHIIAEDKLGEYDVEAVYSSRGIGVCSF